MNARPSSDKRERTSVTSAEAVERGQGQLKFSGTPVPVDLSGTGLETGGVKNAADVDSEIVSVPDRKWELSGKPPGKQKKITTAGRPCTAGKNFRGRRASRNGTERSWCG